MTKTDVAQFTMKNSKYGRYEKPVIPKVGKNIIVVIPHFDGINF